MRKLTRLAAMGTLIASTALPLPFEANAKKVSISGTHTRAEIAQKCDAVGGVKSNTGGTSGGYGCENLDKGTSVNCNEQGQCTGWVPSKKGRDTRSINEVFDVSRRPQINK
jgi:hypothetical protein